MRRARPTSKWAPGAWAAAAEYNRNKPEVRSPVIVGGSSMIRTPNNFKTCASCQPYPLSPRRPKRLSLCSQRKRRRRNLTTARRPYTSLTSVCGSGLTFRSALKGTWLLCGSEGRRGLLGWPRLVRPSQLLAGRGWDVCELRTRGVRWEETGSGVKGRDTMDTKWKVVVNSM
jgi:hypothetical protein